MTLRTVATVLIMGAIMTGPSTPALAAGFCIEPKAPSLLFLTKPSKPVCFNGCSAWQIQSYQDDVRRYFNNLREYAEDVDRYYKKAGDYIQCMADLD